MTLDDARGLAVLLESLGHEACEIIADLFNEAMPDFIWTIKVDDEDDWRFTVRTRPKGTLH